MPKQKVCNDTHEEIIYSGEECPLCRARIVMDAMLDDRTDIDETNIMNLFREHHRLDKRLRRIEKQLGLESTKNRNWLPFLHARLVKETMRTSAQQTQIAPADF